MKVTEEKETEKGSDGVRRSNEEQTQPSDIHSYIAQAFLIWLICAVHFGKQRL